MSIIHDKTYIYRNAHVYNTYTYIDINTQSPLHIIHTHMHIERTTFNQQRGQKDKEIDKKELHLYTKVHTNT